MAAGMGSIFDLLGSTSMLAAPPKKEEKKGPDFSMALGASAFGNLFGGGLLGGDLLSSYDSALSTSAIPSSTSSLASSMTAAKTPAPAAAAADNPFANLFSGSSLMMDFQSILKEEVSKSSLVEEKKKEEKPKADLFSASSIFGGSSMFGDLLNAGGAPPAAAAKPPDTSKQTQAAKDISSRADKLVDEYKSTVATESAKDIQGDNPFASLFSGSSIFAGNSLFANSSLLAPPPEKTDDQKKQEFSDRMQDVMGSTYKPGAAFMTSDKDLAAGTGKTQADAAGSLSALLGTSSLLSGALAGPKVKTEEEKKKEFDERMKALGFGKKKAEPEPEPEATEKEKEPSEEEKKKALAEKMKKFMGGMDFSVLKSEDGDSKTLEGGGSDALALVEKFSMSKEDRQKKEEERLIRITREQMEAEGIFLPEDQLRKMALGQFETPEEAKKRKDARIKQLTDANLRAQGIDPDQKFDTEEKPTGNYKDRVKELMAAKLKAKGIEIDESTIKVEDDGFAARVAEITRANLAAQGIAYQEGDMSMNDPSEKSPEERAKEMADRVKAIMRQKLIDKGINPDAADTSELSEEDAKKAFDARVKELMRKKLAEKGINMDDTSIEEEVGLTPEEKKKRYQERVKRIMAEKLAAKGIKTDADGNIIDDDPLEDKAAFDAKVKSIMADKLKAKGVKIGDDGEPVYDLTEEEKKKLFETRVAELMKTRLTKLGNVTGLEAALALLDRDIDGDNMSKADREKKRQEAIQAKLAEMYEAQQKAEQNRDEEANNKEDEEWMKTLEGLDEKERDEAIKKREHELMVKALVMDMMQVGKKRKKRTKQQLQEEIYEQVERRLPKLECEYKQNAFSKGKCATCKISVYRHTKGDIPKERPKAKGPVPVCASYVKPDNAFMTKCQECGHPEKKHAAKKEGKGGPKGGAAAKKACDKFVQHTNKFKQGQCLTCGFKEAEHTGDDEEDDGEDYSYGDILGHCCGAASVQFAIEFMLEPFFADSDSDESSSGSEDDEESGGED
eukprot:gb/GEZN01000678.1/.p1 GENE.gb/GEZN01000678.1/~~gb/GEZN01000678.1/.p1  ORF type:complete len:1015 (-),score=355.73 gb/GEZN01000678.1/:746-3790(-)